MAPIIDVGGHFENILFQTGQMLLIFYGSLAILIWKCGTQLLTEVKYKSINDDADAKKKAKNAKHNKYQKYIY